LLDSVCVCVCVCVWGGGGCPKLVGILPSPKNFFLIWEMFLVCLGLATFPSFFLPGRLCCKLTRLSGPPPPERDLEIKGLVSLFIRSK